MNQECTCHLFTCLSRRTGASSKCTEPVMSAVFRKCHTCGCSLPDPACSQMVRGLFSHSALKQKAHFAVKSRDSKLQQSNYRKFNMESLGLGLCLSLCFQLQKSSSTSCLPGERRISGTRGALHFGMDVKTKCTDSERHSFLMILCSFSFFIPLLPVPLTAGHFDRQGMGYRAMPTWGFETGDRQPTNLTGTSGLHLSPTMLGSMRRQRTIFLPRVGWVTQSVLSFQREDRRAGSGIQKLVNQGNCMWHCVKNCKELELSMYRKQTSATDNEICWKLYLYFMRES